MLQALRSIYIWVGIAVLTTAMYVVGLPMFLLALTAPLPWGWLFIFLAVFFLFFNTGPANTALAISKSKWLLSSLSPGIGARIASSARVLMERPWMCEALPLRTAGSSRSGRTRPHRRLRE